MNEVPPYDENELTAEDLAVLEAFDSMEHWSPRPTPPPEAAPQQEEPTSKPQSYDISSEEMLMLFVSEAEEDIVRMRRALNQLEQEGHINLARFMTLQRSAHKLRGTAGAVECYGMATIAHYIELLAGQIHNGQIFPLLGVNALTQAVSALERSLAYFATAGHEDETIQTELEITLKNSNVDPHKLEAHQQEAQARTDEETTAHRLLTQPLQDSPLPSTTPSPIPLIRIDPRRIDRLVQHSEQLAEQRIPLESAQVQLETALRELNTAQAQLQQLEPMLFKLLSRERPNRMLEEHSSSLIARILNEASSRNEGHGTRKIRGRTRIARGMAATNSSQWDELNMERYNEKDTQLRALSEAIANVTVASARVQTAFATLNMLQQEYIGQVSLVHDDTLMLRLAPLSTLIPRLQRAITMSAAAQDQQVSFEVSGEETEVDQSILESLANPLLQLLRTCITDTFSTLEAEEANKQQYRTWFHASGVGNEVTIEIGFSMTVHGGALEAIQEPIQRLNGTLALQRNEAGGMSFFLRFPRSHGAAQCLLVRTGNQRLLVPFSQIQHIEDSQRHQFDLLYDLSDLLGFSDHPNRSRVQPVLVMPRGASRRVVGVTVDEVISEFELVVKPLAPYLQRPGISGAAIDGKGSVLLMLDLPELVRRYAILKRNAPPGTPQSDDQRPKKTSAEAKILVADDSVSLRHSLLQTLRRANFAVMEARDGMEALEQLLESVPDVFLLDIEMPNLNGYDLLSIMRLYPELASVKIIMLTSRSSEKHMQRAFELGADAYLVKPCPHDKLLETIQQMLPHS